MCFSAAASFGSGSLLALAGIATLRQTRRTGQWPFAAIPLLFAVQQCAEGMIWLGVPHEGPLAWQHAPVYGFLIFAQIIWPVWIPLALLLIAPPDRKRLIGTVLVLGSCVSAIMACCLLRYGAEAEIIGHHITYALPYPTAISEVCALLYGLATIAPPLMTGIRHMWWLGVGIAISYLATAIFYEYFVLSVWCYFSAQLSVLIYYIQRTNWAIPFPHRSAALLPHPA